MSSAVGVDLSESLIKSVSGSFDLESVFSLDLRGRGLRKLHPCLSQCTSLTALDLSHNSLSASSLIVLNASSLPKLRRLDLSAMSPPLDSLASLPGPLTSLVELRLQGNHIAEIQGAGGIAVLKEKAPNLRALYMQTLPSAGGWGGGGGPTKLTNPACSKPNYRRDVLALLPQLKVLDGERIGGSEFYRIFEALEARTAQYATDAAKAQAERDSSTAVQQQQHPSAPVADWFAGMPRPQALSPSEVESADLAPRLKSLQASLAEARRILTEDPDVALLRELEAKYAPAGGGSTATTTTATPTTSTPAAATAATVAAASTKRQTGGSGADSSRRSNGRRS